MSGDSPIKTETIYDFSAKLRQPSVLPVLKEYVKWWAGIRLADNPELLFSQAPDYGPLSINIDLTTACNYACEHCIDSASLNQKNRFVHDDLKQALDLMCRKGLRSVILIGGGEPTLYSKFEDIVFFLKERNLQVGLVTNGSGMKKIQHVASLLDGKDWVRLSLDSGDNAGFREMHKPRISVTLEEICAGIPPLKAANPELPVGFSFLITWRGALYGDVKIVENIDKMVAATRLARANHFDYIAFKPFLVRAVSNQAELLGIDKESEVFENIIATIRGNIDQARELESDDFKIFESNNLRVLEEGNFRDYTRQPENCHMAFFRQVLSPLGLFNCPACRRVDKARIGDMDVYNTAANFAATQINMSKVLFGFNAAHECQEVTCLYNKANWFIDELINDPDRLLSLQESEERRDYFL
ncbi:radical SAM protein [Planctomycetota bacterium]